MAERFTRAYVLHRLRSQRSEEDVVAAIRTWLALHRIEHTRTDTRQGSSQCGIPDIVGTLPWGQALGIEVKRPGLRACDEGRLRLSQAAWILKQPATSIVLVPNDVAEVDAALGWSMGRWRRLMVLNDTNTSVREMWNMIATQGERWQEIRSRVNQMATARLSSAPARLRRSS